MTNRAQITRQSESHDSTPPASKGSDSRRRRAPFEEADPASADPPVPKRSPAELEHVRKVTLSAIFCT